MIRLWFNDKIVENYKWGEFYDGCVIIGFIYDKFMVGLFFEECLKELKEEYLFEEVICLINIWVYVFFFCLILYLRCWKNEVVELIFE